MNSLGVHQSSQITMNTNSHGIQQLFLPPSNINNLGVHQSSQPTVNMNNIAQLRFPFVIYPVNNLCNMVQVPNNIVFSSTNNAKNAENSMAEAGTKTTTLFNPNLNHSADNVPSTMPIHQNTAITISNSNVIDNTTVNNFSILNNGVTVQSAVALNQILNVQTPVVLKHAFNVPSAVAPHSVVPESVVNLAVTKKCFKKKLTPIRPAPMKNSTTDNCRPTHGTESQNKTLPVNTSKTLVPADVEVTEQTFSVIFQPVQEQDSPPESEKVQVKMEENPVSNELQSSTSIGKDQRVENSLEALYKCCKKIPEYDNYGRKFTNLEAFAQHKHDKEARYCTILCRKPENRPKMNADMMMEQNKKGSRMILDAAHPGLSHKKSVEEVNKSYDCVDCGKPYKKKSLYELQQEQSHSTVKAQTCKCDFCDKAFVFSSSLRSHRLSQTRTKPLACDKCLKTINLKYLLKKYQKKTEPGRFPCDVCGKKLKWKWKLEDHMRRHTGEKAFLCEICGRRFYSPLARSRHMDTHNSSRKRLCEICGKFIKWGSSLRLHQIRHRIHDDLSMKERSDIADIPYICEICGKGFCKKLPYEKHKLNKHERKNKVKKTPDGRMICDTCGKSFSSRSSYRCHIALHKGKMQVACEKCNMVMHKKSLKRHMLKMHKST
ncbi:zinc finger protein ZFP2-like [Saccostrea echinata]|uniref:zinc finger protein ZFP2-like n=1 Tax=Saccostrea echinata TaxID=191078 RepID=UPI002A804244|nr:zinc finger protein ZFP2-like [Saccostrea echinata]